MLTSIPTLSYTSLPEIFYQRLSPSQFKNASLLVLNEELAVAMGLDVDDLRSDKAIGLLSGQAPLEEGAAIAMAYAGHQFGHWAGQLGDGRARLIGEVADRNGDLHEIHLKGSGMTRFSRGGDGNATIGAAIREYIVSEAMAALGVPTTRALSIVMTGEWVQRAIPQKGAILARTARSHIRAGTFQFAENFGDPEDVTALADFAIDRLYREAPSSGVPRYEYFLRVVAERQADLVAKWMQLGFIHGVMNTDNMCVSGETIDYGPCAFMDKFHPGKVFSSIDQNGRYAWNKQPEMAYWNLTRLAGVLLPLLGENDEDRQRCAQLALEAFSVRFQHSFNEGMAHKLGLCPVEADLNTLLPECFRVMTIGGVDFTTFFRALTLHAAGEPKSIVLAQFSDSTIGDTWLESWRTATGADKILTDEKLDKMRAVNPVTIARNHQVEQAIAEANNGQISKFNDLLAAVKQPFSDNPEFAQYQLPPTQDEIVHQTFCGT